MPNAYANPLPYEHTYSILARIHLQSGYKSPLFTLRQLTGRRGYKPLSGLPTQMKIIASNLGMANDAAELVANHTHYHLYAHFLNEIRRKLLWRAMEDGIVPKALTGVAATRVDTRESLRYCPVCTRDDVERYGVAYWHREHMASGISICHRHRRELVTMPRAEHNPERSLALPPYSADGPGNVQTGEFWARNLFIAEQVQNLLTRIPRITIGVEVYRQLIYERGLMTANASVRQRELKKLVSGWLIPLRHEPIFARMQHDLNVERNWAAELVAGGMGFHHPLKHIVLWGALESDAHMIWNTAQQSCEQLELEFASVEESLLTKEAVTNAIEKTGTLRGAATILGVTVTTVSAYADLYGVAFKRRTKSITDELRRRVCNDFQEGQKSAQLAASYGISIGSVNRIIRKIRHTVSN